MTEIRTTHWRSLWISDLHLGTAECKAESLLDFLDRNESETLYLVGNTINGSHQQKRWHWPQAHNDVVQRILRKARSGTRVVLLPANQDTLTRGFIGLSFGNIEVLDEDVHETIDGRRLLVLHGDLFNSLARHTTWLSQCGDTLLEITRWLSHHIEHLRHRLRLGSCSLAENLKHKVKKRTVSIEDYALSMANEARKRGLDGVVCGHIHHPQIRPINGILYCNGGGWISSLSALAEDHEGKLQLLNWTTQSVRHKAETTTARQRRPLSLPSLPSSVRVQNKHS